MITVGIFLLIVWGSIFFLLWNKADEVTKDPCSVCAERVGEKVTCTLPGIRPLFSNYYPNGTINSNFYP
jgi:hypothetical protein